MEKRCTEYRLERNVETRTQMNWRGDRLEREEQIRNHVKSERSGLHEMERRWTAYSLEREKEI